QAGQEACQAAMVGNVDLAERLPIARSHPLQQPAVAFVTHLLGAIQGCWHGQEARVIRVMRRWVPGRDAPGSSPQNAQATVTASGPPDGPMEYCRCVLSCTQIQARFIRQ